MIKSSIGNCNKATLVRQATRETVEMNKNNLVSANLAKHRSDFMSE